MNKKVYRGKDVKTLNITDKNGKLVSLRTVYENEDLIIITDSGMTIRMEISQISTLSRNTQGVRLINLKEDQKVSATAVIEKEDTEDNQEEITLSVEKNDENSSKIDEDLIDEEKIEQNDDKEEE